MKYGAALTALVGACAASPGASAPALVVTTPVASTPLSVEPGAVTDDSAPPFEMAIDFARVCVRIEGRVHCGDGPADGRALFAGPADFGIEDAVSVAVGRGFGCIARRAGTVHCFGTNEQGELGAGMREEKSDVAVAVKGIHDAVRVAASGSHACAILRDGGVRCWGENDHGESGSSVVYTAEARELVEPQSIPGVSAKALALGAFASCAVTTSRGVACWGASGFDDVQSEVPRTAAGVADVDELAAGDQTFCALRGGGVTCIGSSYSLLPDFRGKTDKPIAVALHGRVRHVRLADSHACAVLVDGRVECWGANGEGAVGRPEGLGSAETLVPAPVPGLPRAVDVFVGGAMSCALGDRGDLHCWGRWTVDGAERHAPAPVAVRIE